MCTDLYNFIMSLPSIAKPQAKPTWTFLPDLQELVSLGVLPQIYLFYHPGSQPEPQSLPLFSLDDTELLSPPSKKGINRSR